MSIRFLPTFALAFASAVVLTFSTSAYACDKDCNCDGTSDAAQQQKQGATSAKPSNEADLANGGVQRFAAAARCHCEKGGKGCTCPKGQCECENCKDHHHRS